MQFSIESNEISNDFSWCIIVGRNWSKKRDFEEHLSSNRRRKSTVSPKWKYQKPMKYQQGNQQLSTYKWVSDKGPSETVSASDSVTYKRQLTDNFEYWIAWPLQFRGLKWRFTLLFITSTMSMNELSCSP